ncbi:MAG: protein-disulfide reductase DsbD family protein [Pirellulales bacterium]
MFFLLTLGTFVAAQTTPDADTAAANAAAIDALFAKADWKTDEFHTQNDELTIRARLTPATVKPGQKTTLELTLTPSKGFYFYDYVDRLTAPQTGTGRATLVNFAAKSNLVIGKGKRSVEPLEKTDDDGRVQYYYKEPLTLSFDVLVPTDHVPGEAAIAGVLGVQFCSDESCLQTGLLFHGTFAIGEGSAAKSEFRFAAVPYSTPEKLAPQACRWSNRVRIPPPPRIRSRPASGKTGRPFRIRARARLLRPSFRGSTNPRSRSWNRSTTNRSRRRWP